MTASSWSETPRSAFEDDAFDAAVAAFVLHHVPSRARHGGARASSGVAVAQMGRDGTRGYSDESRKAIGRGRVRGCSSLGGHRDQRPPRARL